MAEKKIAKPKVEKLEKKSSPFTANPGGSSKPLALQRVGGFCTYHQILPRSIRRAPRAARDARLIRGPSIRNSTDIPGLSRPPSLPTSTSTSDVPGPEAARGGSISAFSAPSTIPLWLETRATIPANVREG